jgi:hypothetical protein
MPSKKGGGGVNLRNLRLSPGNSLSLRENVGERGLIQRFIKRFIGQWSYLSMGKHGIIRG